MRRQQPAVCPQGRKHHGQTGALCGRPRVESGLDYVRVFGGPIAPDIVTETPLEDALGWIANNIIARP